MKSVVVIVLGFLAFACARQEVQPQALGSCWNVNTLDAGRVAGDGLLISHMHGLSLQALGCDDRKGRNPYELEPSADRLLRAELPALRGERFIGFSFSGRIEGKVPNRTLVIEHISQVRAAPKPQWLIDLERRFPLPRD